MWECEACGAPGTYRPDLEHYACDGCYAEWQVLFLETTLGWDAPTEV